MNKYSAIFYYPVFRLKSITNGVDPYQTALGDAVLSGSAMFAIPSASFRHSEANLLNFSVIAAL